MSIQKQLLDPLGTLCKLVALNFTDLKTKISIHNYILNLQKPNTYQPVLRLCFGDGRENVSELYYVIIRIIKWYLVPTEEASLPARNIVNSAELRKLVNYLCTGFKKLQETYETGNVIFALQFYINLLEGALNGNFTDTSLPQHIVAKEQQYDNLLDYEKLKNLWDIETLSRISDLYDNCFTAQLDENITQNKRTAFIESYLQSINGILDTTDNEFQKLIQNSTKG